MELQQRNKAEDFSENIPPLSLKKLQSTYYFCLNCSAFRFLPVCIFLKLNILFSIFKEYTTLVMNRCSHLRLCVI